MTWHGLPLLPSLYPLCLPHCTHGRQTGTLQAFISRRQGDSSHMPSPWHVYIADKAACVVAAHPLAPVSHSLPPSLTFQTKKLAVVIGITPTHSRLPMGQGQFLPTFIFLLLFPFPSLPKPPAHWPSPQPAYHHPHPHHTTPPTLLSAPYHCASHLFTHLHCCHCFPYPTPDPSLILPLGTS